MTESDTETDKNLNIIFCNTVFLGCYATETELAWLVQLVRYEIGILIFSFVLKRSYLFHLEMIRTNDSQTK